MDASPAAVQENRAILGELERLAFTVRRHPERELATREASLERCSRRLWPRSGAMKKPAPERHGPLRGERARRSEGHLVDRRIAASKLDPRGPVIAAHDGIVGAPLAVELGGMADLNLLVEG